MPTTHVLGIAGGTGSGKTTIADRIASALGDAVARLDHDSYYKAQPDSNLEERQQTNYDHPSALDNALLLEHIRALRAGRPIDKPRYDFCQHQRMLETDRVEPRPVILVEGILTLAIPELLKAFDVKIFVDTAADIRLMRRIRRDLELRGRSFADIRHQYYATVRPMHMAFIEPSKQHADIIIPEGGKNMIAVDMVVGHLREVLRNTSTHAP